jgi:hypothetical protein
MKDIWLIGAFAAVLASVPAHLRDKVEPQEGGTQPQQTQAIPLLMGDKQYVLISFYEMDGPTYGELPKIYPPFASAYVSYPSKEVKWQDVTANDFNLISLPLDALKKPYLGELHPGQAASVQEWRSAEREYERLVSLVLERRWLLTRHAVTAEERATAQELQECTRLLYDKPLLPYYQHAGRHFLAWMERAAK